MRSEAKGRSQERPGTNCDNVAVPYWDRCDIVEAHYWYAVRWHEGQWSRLYARQCKIRRYWKPPIIGLCGPLEARAEGPTTANARAILRRLEGLEDV